jgi:mycothiol synthase
VELTWRALTKDDVPAVTRLLAAAEKVDDTGEHLDEDDVTEWFSTPGMDLAEDTLGAYAGDSLVAAGMVMAPENVRTEDRISLEGVVHPSARRQGLGAELLRRQESRAASLHAARFPSLPGETELSAYETVPSKRALIAAAGYRDIRWWNEMRHPLSPLPPVPAVPAGLRVVGYDPSFSEATRVAHNSAFSEHFGSSERSPEVWEHWFAGSTHFTASDSFLVLDGSSIAAYLLTHFYPADAEATGRRTAWIGQLGTLDGYRKRGLGTLLLATALAAYRSAGYDAAELGVDTSNVTGALALYERIGFVPVRRSITSVKTLDDRAAPPG